MARLECSPLASEVLRDFAYSRIDLHHGNNFSRLIYPFSSTHLTQQGQRPSYEKTRVFTLADPVTCIIEQGVDGKLIGDERCHVLDKK